MKLNLLNIFRDYDFYMKKVMLMQYDLFLMQSGEKYEICGLTKKGPTISIINKIGKIENLKVDKDMEIEVSGIEEDLQYLSNFPA